MLERIKFNLEKCEVDKRRLVLDCDILIQHKYINYVFTHDHWGQWEDKIITELRLDGKKFKNSVGNYFNFKLIEAYKHRVLAYFTGDADSAVIVDRRYEHNHEFNVYYEGKSYLVIPKTNGTDKS